MGEEVADMRSQPDSPGRAFPFPSHPFVGGMDGDACAKCGERAYVHPRRIGVPGPLPQPPDLAPPGGDAA